MWKICYSGATFRATLLDISWNILKHKGNKSHFLKEINEWTVIKSLKNASHVVQGKNTRIVAVSNVGDDVYETRYWCWDNDFKR